MKRIHTSIWLGATIVTLVIPNASAFDGLDTGIGNLHRLSDAKSRSISLENFTGAQDISGMIIQTNIHPKPISLQASPNGRFLQYAGGTPFFYLADTAWMLPNKLTEEEARRLFADRSAKGFTVIQSLIFRDLFVPNSANVHGVKPFASEADMDAAKLNPKWLDWVVRITTMAADHGLVMAWLPTWGDKWTKRNNSAGPVIFDKASKAEAYGRDLSDALGECDNVIWVRGGDGDIETPAQADIMRAMARGLRSGASRGRLITFHPAGGLTSAIFSSEDWLDINTVQSGHGRLNSPNYLQIETLYNTLPTRPCLDIESIYERIPVGSRRQNGIPPEHRAFFDDYDVRRSHYRSVLAGTAGFACGCEPICQIYRPGDRSHAWDGQGIQTWEEGLAAPGSSQLQLLKRLLLDRSYFTRIPDRGLLRELDIGGNDDPVSHIAVARCSAGGYILVSVPVRQMLTIDTSVLPAKRLRISEYDPEAGVQLHTWEIKNSGIYRHIPSRRLDTLLVIDAINP